MDYINTLKNILSFMFKAATINHVIHNRLAEEDFKKDLIVHPPSKHKISAYFINKGNR